MKKLLLILAGALTLTGCATGQAEYYAAETARHAEQAERWKAMGRIAESGDVTAKAVALAVMGNAGAGQQQATAAPRSPAADWLQFAGVLLPAAIQGYGIRQQTQLGMRQSDNGARQSIAVAEYGVRGVESTNAAFVGIAGKIQAAGAVTTYSANQANVTTSTANPVTTTTSTANPVTTTANPVTTTTTANPVTTTDTNTYTANPVTTTTSQAAPVAAALE